MSEYKGEDGVMREGVKEGRGERGECSPRLLRSNLEEQHCKNTSTERFDYYPLTSPSSSHTLLKHLLRLIKGRMSYNSFLFS